MANEILQGTPLPNPLGTLSILPPEIRQAIYILAIESPSIEFRTESYDPKKEDMELSLLQAIDLLHISRPIRQEAIAAICHYKTITIKTKDSLTRFINTVIQQNSGTGNTNNLSTCSIHPRYLKIDLTDWLRTWRHTTEDVLRRQSKEGDKIKYYLRRDLESELGDWAKRLIGLCGRARSKLILRVVFPTMLDHLKFQTEIKNFLRRIATRYYMATRGQMKCVAEVQPGLDEGERVSWKSQLGAFLDIEFLEGVEDGVHWAFWTWV